MPLITSRSIRHWIVLGMALVLIVCVAYWFIGRERLPGTVRIATGEQGGLYYKIGLELCEPLRRRIGRDVSAETTAGSRQNYAKLINGEVDLAIVQGGSVKLQDVSVVTPLFPEMLMIIVRKGSQIRDIPDLEGRNVAIGKEGSGNRSSAIAVLRHFDVGTEELGINDLHFTSLIDDLSLDAAVVTAGIAHPDLVKVLATNEFEILPIQSAPAIDMVHPFLRNVRIPRGLFAERPSVPAVSIPTIATTAYLVARNDTPDRIVRGALAAVHEESLRLHVPTLIARKEAPSWISTRLHEAAHQYFNPADDLGEIVSVMESIVATKELLFALGAGVFLLWHRWRQLKERETQEFLSRQKEHLDTLLEKTLRIEAALETDDPVKLRVYLDEVTRVKIDALREFTEEELRGDQTFTIFLEQCANLMNKIQLKIISSGR